MIDDKKEINPFIVGACFLEFCIEKGWIEKEGDGKETHYYITSNGVDELRKFGVKGERLFI